MRGLLPAEADNVEAANKEALRLRAVPSTTEKNQTCPDVRTYEAMAAYDFYATLRDG